jgi:CRP-like cAMP-binding protein
MMGLEDVGLDKEILSNIQISYSFNQDEFNDLLKSTTFMKAEKNCELIKPGETVGDCYIVIRGAVQSSIVLKNKIAKLSVIGPVTLFCSTATVDESLSSVTLFVTREKTILLKINKSQLEEQHPVLWRKLFYFVYRSLVALEKSFHKLNLRLNIELYNR